MPWRLATRFDVLPGQVCNDLMAQGLMLWPVGPQTLSCAIMHVALDTLRHLCLGTNQYYIHRVSLRELLGNLNIGYLNVYINTCRASHAYRSVGRLLYIYIHIYVIYTYRLPPACQQGPQPQLYIYIYIYINTMKSGDDHQHDEKERLSF